MSTISSTRLLWQICVIPLLCKKKQTQTSHKVNLLIGAWNDIQIYQFWYSKRAKFSRQCSAPAVSSTSSVHKSIELALRDYPIKTQMYALKCISQIVNRRNKLLHVQHYGNDLWFMMQFFLFPFMFWEQFSRRSHFEMIWNVIWGGGAWVFTAQSELTSLNLCIWSFSIWIALFHDNI